MCQSEYVLSKFNIFFSHVASVTCASQNYTILTSSLATEKAHLIAQVPVTYLQFPGLPLLLFLEEGKKNGQKRNRNLWAPFQPSGTKPALCDLLRIFREVSPILTLISIYFQVGFLLGSLSTLNISNTLGCAPVQCLSLLNPPLFLKGSVSHLWDVA